MLDKGLVIAGDIKVSLAEVELLTIRIRLLVCSLDKAQEIGLDWWRYDRELSPGAQRAAIAEHDELRAQIQQLERKVNALTAPRTRSPADAVSTRSGAERARRDCPTPGAENGS